MSEFRVIVVPYELGRLRDGTGSGAEALLAGGAEVALTAGGATVTTELIELDPIHGTTGHGDVDASFALIGEVAERVRRAVADGALPVVLGGSCFLAVGVAAGLERAPIVVWLDAHPDFNHPESSAHGYFDGMGLTVMTGGAWQGMLEQLPGGGTVPESDVILAGAREFDPAELERLEASGIHHLAPARLRSPDALIDTLAEIRPSPADVYLHLDLDVLDRSVAQVNVYGAPGGIDAGELEDLVAAVASRNRVRALALTCYDAALDPAGRVPPIANRILEAVAAVRV